MEDFNLKLQGIDKEKSKVKIVLRFLLSLSLVFLLIFISIKILNTFYNEKIIDIKNIPLIKSEQKPIKVKPEDSGGLLVDNLDIGVYNVIDEKKENNEIKINKESGQTTKEDLLSQKIDEIVSDNSLWDEVYIEEKQSITDVLQTKNKTADVDKNTPPDTTAKEEVKNNIKINTEKKEGASDKSKLEILGNKALIKNLKENKDMKPGIKIQLLASKSKKGVLDYWNNLQKKYNNLFKDLNYYVEDVKLNNNDSVYRLRVGIFKDEESADSFCKEYIKITNKNKIDCIILKSNN